MKKISETIFRALTFFIFRKIHGSYTKIKHTFKPMYVSPYDTAGFATIVWGVWERWNIEVARKLILQNNKKFANNKKNLFIDVGANLGIYSLNLAKDYCDKVLSIEASPVVIKVLEANVLSNSLDDFVDIKNIGFGFNEGFMDLNVSLKNSGMTSFLNTNEVINTNKDDQKKIPIEVVKGDTLINQNYSSAYNISFIKVDVEGFEFDVFKGMEETLRDSQAIIQLEYTGADPRTGEIIADNTNEGMFEYLYEIGYTNKYVLTGMFEKFMRPNGNFLGSVGIWPGLKKIEKIEAKFYQAIWLSKEDLNS